MKVDAYKVIFFDLDGTLIDTSQRHYKVYQDILSATHNHATQLSKEEYWIQKRNGQKTAEILSAPDELVQKFSSMWLKLIEARNYLMLDTVFPETFEVLFKLKSRSKLVLMTLRNNKSNLYWQLGALGLTCLFSKILIDSPQAKDKISLITKYMKNNPAGKDACVVVGDSEVDIKSGKSLGYLTIAHTNGLRSKAFLCELAPDFLVDNLTEVLPILNQSFHGNHVFREERIRP